MAMGWRGVMCVVVCWMGLVGEVVGAPWVLRDYKLCKERRLMGIWDNASGVTYDESSGKIWVVSRSPLAMLQYDLDGNLKQKKGIPNMHDPEGVAYMWEGQFALVEESFGIKEMKFQNDYWLKETSSLGVKLHSGGYNSGIEGLSFDSRHECFYVVQEKHDKSVIEVSRSGENKVLFKAHHIGVGDMAGIHYSPQEDVFYILSQESRKIVKVARNGWVLETISIGGRRPEGLTFTPDGQLMIVVAEPNQLLVYCA